MNRDGGAYNLSTTYDHILVMCFASEVRPYGGIEMCVLLLVVVMS